MTENLKRAPDGIIEAPARARFLITTIPQINRMEIVDHETGEERTISFRDKKERDRYTNFLEHMYLTVGTEGPQNIRTIPHHYSPTAFPNYVSRMIADTAINLQEMLPEGVIAIHADFNSAVGGMDGELSFGHLALASRKATPEELREAKAPKKKEPVPELTKRNFENEDTRKERLLEYDHALVTVGDKRYFLDLDPALPDSLLAAHIITALRTRFSNVTLDPRSFVYSIWSRLPVAERFLLTSDEHKVYTDRPFKGFDTKVSDILRQLARPLEIIDTLSRPQGHIQVELMTDSPTRESIRGARPLFPPGTERAIALGAKREPPPHEQVAAAKKALAFLANPSDPIYESLHDAGIAMLDAFMSKEAKRALAVA